MAGRLKVKRDITAWALLELMEDLEDSAFDFGAYNTPKAEKRFFEASEKLRRAIGLAFRRQR
jgi:hypothetical protein